MFSVPKIYPDRHPSQVMVSGFPRSLPHKSSHRPQRLLPAAFPMAALPSDQRRPPESLNGVCTPSHRPRGGKNWRSSQRPASSRAWTCAGTSVLANAIHRVNHRKAEQRNGDRSAAWECVGEAGLKITTTIYVRRPTTVKGTTLVSCRYRPALPQPLPLTGTDAPRYTCTTYVVAR